jgi:hypothetical protein
MSEDQLTGGKEGQLEGLGTFFLVAGIVGAAFGLWYSGYVTKVESYDDWGDEFSAAWIYISLASLIQGIFFYILLTAGAEVLRLLKKLNGLPYGGEISTPHRAEAFSPQGFVLRDPDPKADPPKQDET